jgi:hypothetical protein
LGEENLSKVVSKKKKRKQGLDFWMKNKPMVLGLLNVDGFSLRV